ncbi:hypothetical protein C8R46DRAFT_851209, partial [Mycena filopes]
VGMPILIKVNQATELCITKGQEAKVVGWDASVGTHGRRVLDTLFVELTKPPRPVHIPGLPVNVVPLGRVSTHITSLLRDDSLISLNREQVVVLPNFAMTDYSSQGKSRNPNVVHLNYCKDHRACYVALSRGHQADDTVIIQAFETKKITSGMSGYLRQEFRELELLDEITKLRWEGSLPRTVTGVYRGQLLASFRAWKGGVEDPTYFHDAIRYNSKLDDGNGQPVDYGEWRPTINGPSSKPPVVATPKKPAASRKRAGDPLAAAVVKRSRVAAPPAQPRNIERPQPAFQREPVQAPPVARARLAVRRPLGLVWDSVNHSCAYDSLFTPLLELWQDDPEVWTARLSQSSAWLGVWALSAAQSPAWPEHARDAVRTLLNFQDPQAFPTGPHGVMLHNLFTAMTNRHGYVHAATKCERCGYEAPGLTETLGQYMDISQSRTITDTYPQGMTLMEWFRYQFDRPVARCPQCSTDADLHRMRRLTTVAEVPPVMIFSISIDTLRLDEYLEFDVASRHQRLKLAGLMYHTAAPGHFTSIVVDKASRMWFHDGITTKRSC